MNGGVGKWQVLNGNIAEYYRMREMVASTYSAQAFKASNIRSREEVVVWITRAPIASRETERFERRLRKLFGAPQVQQIALCGVDKENLGYAVLPPYKGRGIGWRFKNAAELERRFLGCLRIVEGLHAKAISCGDICPESFVLDSDGSISLFSVLGDVALENRFDETGPRPHEKFRSHEQRVSGIQSPASDVYALAWMAEDLFTHKPDNKNGQSITPPAWLKKALRAVSSPGSNEEVTSALALRLILEEAVAADSAGSSESATEVDFALVKIPNEADDAKLKGDSMGADVNRGDGSEESISSSADSIRGRWIDAVLGPANRVIILFLLNVIALGGLFLSFVLERDGGKGASNVQALTVARRVESQEIRDLINSDAPPAHQALVDQLQGSAEPSRTEFIARGILERSRRLGLMRTSDVALRFSQRHGGFDALRAAASSAVLARLLDPSIALDSRLEQVTALYETDPRLSVVIAGSLALDTGSLDSFWGVFARSAADQLGVVDAREHSPVALMLLIPDVRDLFSEDVFSLQSRLSEIDISWLLAELGQRGVVELGQLARLANNRKIVDGARSVFLIELERSATIDSVVRSALVSGALGQLTESHVRSLSQWYGEGAARVLQAGIITSGELTVRRAAFEVLRSKPIADEYVAKVLEFVQSTYKEHSGDYAKVVAAIALRDVLSRDAVRANVQGLQRVPHLKELLRTVVRGAPPEVVEVVLDIYEREIDPVDTIDLLGSSVKRVRLAAISHLSYVNDALLLTLIRQAYEEEKDPEVRSAFETKISTIKDRFGGARVS